ncbi:hypothetical protein [Thiosulfativibrio zosterae]|uniref:Uncharacterized protein n=1 Tax=Thiosulfativibrio zosterae TaxID=2675053 RepID=A0A6F8PPX9_9GAMM|nr:hypothetical protein [Thiosulfativibrio zosterae]BBP44182.1 hypothetical protein THMIRHAT_19280 [Thiosulfativibrio zosterae]
MTSNRVWVSLSSAKVAELMAAGHLSGVDLHSPDPEVKALIRQACLQSCALQTCQSCPQKAVCQLGEQQVSEVTWSKVPLSVQGVFSSSAEGL